MRGIKVTRVLAERPIDPLALPKMSFFLLRNLVFDVAFKMCHMQLESCRLFFPLFVIHASLAGATVRLGV